MTNLAVIARFTLQEAISRRLILAGLLISLAFIGLFALGFSFLHSQVVGGTFGRGTGSTPALAAFGSMMTVLGLYAVHFLSSFLALFLSVGAVSSEIDSGTLHAVLARPIRRIEFVVGRWIGYVALLAAYVGFLAGTLLVLARVISGYQAPEPARAIALLMLSAVVLLSLSLFGSTLLSTLANGMVVFTLFGLAWLAGIIEFIGQQLSSQAMVNLGILMSLLVPTDAVWRGASYYVQSPLFLAALGANRDGIPFASGAPPTDALVIWALLHPLAFLVAAIVAFSKRDL